MTTAPFRDTTGLKKISKPDFSLLKGTIKVSFSALHVKIV